MTGPPAPLDARPGAPGGGLSHRQIMVVMGGLLTGTALAALDGTVVNTALPTIVGEFGGLDEIAWVGTAYLLTSTASTALSGKLSDLYGRRWIFQLSIVIFMVGSLGCGLAQSLLQLVASRAVQGVGGGGLVAMGLVILGDIVSPRARGRYTALVSGTFALAAVLGPLIGGFFVEHLSWRWVFLVNLPLGAVAMAVTHRALRLPRPDVEHRIDWLGAGLLLPSMTCLLLVAVWGGSSHPWGSPTIVGLAAAGLVLGGLFLAHERRAPEPILPLELFHNPVYAVGMVISVITGALLYTSAAFLPLYLQTVTGAGATVSGLLMAPLMGGAFAASLTGGRLLVRTGRYKPLPIVGLALAGAGVAALTGLEASTTRLLTSAAMFCLGVGIGLTNPTITVAVQNSVDQRDLGSATSGVAFFRALGGAVGLAALGTVLNARFRHELPAGAADGAEHFLADPTQIAQLAEPLRGDLTGAMAGAVGAVFLVALPFVFGAWVLAWFLRELPLRTTSYAHALAESP